MNMMRGNPKPWAVALLRVASLVVHAPTVAGTPTQRSAHLQSRVLYGREQQFESDKNNELDARTFMKWQRLARCERFEAHT